MTLSRAGEMLFSWPPPCSNEEDKGWKRSASLAPWPPLALQQRAGRAKRYLWGLWGTSRTQRRQERGKDPTFPSWSTLSYPGAGSIHQDDGTSRGLAKRGLQSHMWCHKPTDPYPKAVIPAVTVQSGAIELQMMLVITLQSRGFICGQFMSHRSWGKESSN